MGWKSLKSDRVVVSAVTRLANIQSPPLGVCVLIVGIVASIVSRVFSRRGTILIGVGGNGEPPERSVCVCVRCSAADDWRGCVTAFARSAWCRSYVSFGVVLECSDAGDVDRHDRTEMRGFVDIHFATPSSSRCKSGGRVRDTIRRFLDGTESLVVVADHRVRPVQDWDRLLMDCDAERNALVTCPVSAHACSFPTLRKRQSTETVVRSLSTSMCHEGTTEVVPSVCWCPEFTAGHSQSFLTWCRRRQHGRSCDNTTRKGGVLESIDGTQRARGFPPFSLPTFRLLLPDKDTEETILDSNEDHPTPHMPSQTTVPATLGLVLSQCSYEMYYKFGSSSAANIAMKLQKREGPGGAT